MVILQLSSSGVDLLVLLRRVRKEERGQVVRVQADLSFHLCFWWLHLVEEVDVVLFVLFRFQLFFELGLGSRRSPALPSEASGVCNGVDAWQVAQAVDLSRRVLIQRIALALSK